MNLSPPGVFGLAGVLDADLDARKINRFKLELNYIVSNIMNCLKLHFSQKTINIFKLVPTI